MHLTTIATRRAIETAARALGFDAIGIADVELGEDERHLEHWLARGWHGQMHYMARHGRRRSRPAELLPGTLRVISRAHELLGPARRVPRRKCWRDAGASPTYRAMRWAATTTS